MARNICVSYSLRCLIWYRARLRQIEPLNDQLVANAQTKSGPVMLRAGQMYRLQSKWKWGGKKDLAVMIL